MTWDVLETDGVTGSNKSAYLRGSGLVCQMIGSNALYYRLNVHGDVVQKISANGTITHSYKYDAFGNQRTEPNDGMQPIPESVDSDPNPFRYCGEYYDSDTGEIYLRARMYDPRTGRFSAEDSAKDGANWYTYCGGNPITRIDPSGNAYDDVKLGLVPPKKPTPPKPKPPTPPTSPPPSPPVGPPAPPPPAPPPPHILSNYQYNLMYTSFGPGMFIFGQGSKSNTDAYRLKMGKKGHLGADTGCGWVAAYNVLQIKGDYEHPAEIINHIEENGGVRLGGAGGVWGSAVEGYLNDYGYDAQLRDYNRNAMGKLDAEIQQADAVIIQYIWGNLIDGMGMHYVAIEYDTASGEYFVYNERGNDTVYTPYTSIDQWIKDGKYVPVSYIYVA